MLPKLLLYVSFDQLCAYRWRRGQLAPAGRFAADREGQGAFGRFLANERAMRTYLVADLVEEDFQRHLLPHVGGRAGRNLVERRLAQLYRDTPYRHADIQGRASEGRRDDHALFSALTNAALLQPWVALLEEHKTPLAAIYSAAFLSTLLVKKLALAQDHLLLISEQSGGLRQSYFEGGHLKFSRLTALAPFDDITAATASETERMQQFLSSTRMQGRGEMLHVVVLAPAARMPALEQACADDPEVSFHFIDMAAASARMNLDHTPALADTLLLAVLAQHTPPTQYALKAGGRFYRMWQARFGLNLAAASLASAAAAGLLVNVWQIIDAGQQRRALLAEAAQLDGRYHAVMATLPPMATRTANMKAAVMLDQLLEAQAPAPGQLAALVSNAVERAPAISLNALDWQVLQAPDNRAAVVAAGVAAAVPAAVAVPAPVTPGAGDPHAPLSSALVGLPSRPAQVLRIDGEVEAPATDYRTVLHHMNAFAADLARTPGVRVDIVEAPIDVRQNVKVSGASGGSPDAGAKPKFVLTLTWQP